MAISPQVIERVFQKIDGDELVRIALEMGRIFAPMGREKPMADYVLQWLEDNGLDAQRRVAAPERDNVVSVLPGTGGGKSLIFNAHMDTELAPEENVWALADIEEAVPRSWAVGDRIFGRSVLNDRGSMACYMIATKALKDSGVRLRGDVIQTMVVGEVDMSPVDEFQGPRYEGIGFGTQHLLQHGLTGDYALVAETTDFATVWMECGVAYFKVTTSGQTSYTPRSSRTERIEDHPNAIVKMAYLIQKLEEWARQYEAENTRDYGNGTVIPKVVVGAVRGGVPYRPARTSGVCSAYVDVRILPDSSPREVERNLRSFVEGLGLGAKVEMYLARRGYVAENVEPLRDAVAAAHRQVVGGEPGQGSIEERSMWRDINLFNEWGIPSLTYGPPRHVMTEAPDPSWKGATDPSGKVKYFLKDDLIKTAQIYALTALQICGVDED